MGGFGRWLRIWSGLVVVSLQSQVSPVINTHNLRCDFGKHKGELWTRMPVSYLKWLVNQPKRNPGDIAGDIASAELARRGTVTPTLEVSGHAIDRASLSCRAIWHQTALSKDEGLHAWLCRVAAECLATQPPERATLAENAKIPYLGMLFVFEFGECWPTLKTVMRDDSQAQRPGVSHDK
jgi:hypothetical protein